MTCHLQINIKTINCSLQNPLTHQLVSSDCSRIAVNFVNNGERFKSGQSKSQDIYKFLVKTFVLVSVCIKVLQVAIDKL